MNDLVGSLAEHRFRDLFIEVLGWDHASGVLDVSADDCSFSFSIIAQKRGLQVLHGHTDRLTLMNRGRLRRVQRKLAGLIHEHVVIYSCDSPRKQVWQWAVRLADGRRLRHREHPFFSASPPPCLLGRLEALRFTLQEEEGITLIDALQRVRRSLDTAADLNLFVNRPWYAERSDQLARAMETGGDAELEEFLLFHRPLVTWCVRPLLYLYGNDLEDAEQVGMLGLLHAARRFKPDRGLQFSTYAVQCVKGFCKHQASLWFLPIRVPPHVLWPCLKLQRTLQRVLVNGGPRAVEDYLLELAIRDRSLAKEWRQFSHAASIRSLSQPREPEYWEARRILDSTQSLSVRVVRHEKAERVREALAMLKPRDAGFVRLKYGLEGEEQTLESIGNSYGVTRERVRQRLVKVLERLQRDLGPYMDWRPIENGGEPADDELSEAITGWEDDMRDNCTLFTPGEPTFPAALRNRLQDSRTGPIAAIGSPCLLDRNVVAFFCSSTCPGSVILDIYDLARALRDAGVTVISGFHSPMERECLEILLRGSQPIIICPARGIQRMRIPKAWKQALEQGRILILSPFQETCRSVDADLAVKRNRFAAQLADEVFIAHAAGGGKTEAFCRELLEQGKSLLTLDRAANRSLPELRMKPLAIKDVSKRWPPLSEPKNECRKGDK